LQNHIEGKLKGNWCLLRMELVTAIADVFGKVELVWEGI